jgi:hypothetical protein
MSAFPGYGLHTYDRYGHLMPGNETEAAALLDEYLARTAASASASTKAAT